MAKVHSRYLNCDFDVLVNEKNRDGEMVSIISHESLRDIISNQIPMKMGVNYTYENFGNNHHPVVCCTMYDKAGRKVQALGEATQSSLETENSKRFPTVIAAQRAFDRAAIDFLAFPGKIIAEDDNKNSAVSQQSKTLVGKALPSMPKEISGVNDPDDLAVADLTEFEDDFEPIDAPTACEAELIINDEEDVFSASSASSSELDELGNVIINIGKFKNAPAKLSEVYEKEKKWLVYVTDKTIVTDANRTQIEAGKRYLALKK